jgi:hypothetical protein
MWSPDTFREMLSLKVFHNNGSPRYSSITASSYPTTNSSGRRGGIAAGTRVDLIVAVRTVGVNRYAIGASVHASNSGIHP